MSKSTARSTFRRFHGGDRTSIWPNEKRLHVRVPDQLVCAGDAILVWYLSDKILDDADGSKVESYEHEFGRGVRLYYDEKLWDEHDDEFYELKVPSAWTVLGILEGWAFRSQIGDREVRLDDGILLWDDDSKTLGLLHEEGKYLLGIITGGNLRLTRYGIEG